MTAREIVKKRLQHQGTEITPYTVLFEPELYKKLTAYYGSENWEAEKLRQFHADYLAVDTVLMKAKDDIFAEDGYGALWRMDKKPWHLYESPLKEPSMEGYEYLSADKFVQPILRDKPAAIAKYNADSQHFRVINMGWGIFENTWRMRGFENALMDMLIEEDFYFEMTQQLTELYLNMLKACEDVPADAFLFGDDWGDQRGVIMGAKSWRKFIKPCWESIYAEVHRQGKVVMQHSCGSIADIYDDLAEIGMDCHESVQPEATGMRPEVIKERWGNKISFWGCLGSQGILHHGTPQEIHDEIFRLRDLFRKDGGYILAPAKPLQDEMEIEKAVAVVEALSVLNE